MQIELADEVRISEGLKAETRDRTGEAIAESISFDTERLSVSSHVDRRARTFSTKIARAAGWRRSSTTEEEEAVGQAMATVLGAESGIEWTLTLVPQRDQPPDLRLTPKTPTAIEVHEVEVRHLDDTVVGEVNAGRSLDRDETLEVLEVMLNDAVEAKRSHYAPSSVPTLTLALQVPMPVGAAYVEALRAIARELSDGFRELWLVADGEAYRLRP